MSRIRSVVRVHLEDGNHFETTINLKPDEAEMYYVGQEWNMGIVDDDMKICTGIEILKTEEVEW